MKKVLSLLLSVVFILSVFVGCGKTAPSDKEVAALFKDAADTVFTYLGDADSAAGKAFDGYESYTGKDAEITANNKLYLKTNCKYKDAEDKYSKVFSGEFSDAFLDCFFYDNDGTMYIRQNGRTGAVADNVSVKLEKEDGDKYYYTVTYDRFEGEDTAGEPTNGKFTVENTADGLRICNMDFVLD